jgi:P-type Ca2+ transporter type 2C
MDWHALSVKEVFEKLHATKEGLLHNEISKRLEQYGKNKILKKRKFTALRIFSQQFKSILVLLLIAASILSFFMGSTIDAIAIATIIVINAAFGFSQEYKAEKAIEELQKIMVSQATVIREGRIQKIDSENIVPGDILILQEGDKIMADARVITSEGLKVNEASLTGESVPEDKTTATLPVQTTLADRTNIVYQGTVVINGSGHAIVCDTGSLTELGKISTLVQEISPEKTPFQKSIDYFAQRVGIFIMILSVLIVGMMIFTGFELSQSFLIAVSLAVSSIPEGLPAVISLGLALATRRMAKNNVLIRKLPASETLGRTTIICTDKTGTITEEKMKVTAIYANGEMNPEKGKEIVLKIGLLCNKANLEKDEQGKEYSIGDPTEIALLKSAQDNFLEKKELIKKEPKIKEFPFNSNRKMMSIIRKQDNHYISYVKGAPETMIARSKFEFINGRKIALTEENRYKLVQTYELMAGKGLRVLGFAFKELSKKDLSEKEAEQDLVFAGLQGMIDPPRQGVKEAIRMCKQAGMRVIMITGDSALTAEAVAKEIGLEGKSVHSEKLQKMTDRELFSEIDSVSVFSRIFPEDKLRIINVLKQKNNVVAMTGDGVNDALALKRADIGIAMGIRGTDVARESAEIVLVDDNFASIVEGVREGRGIYANTKKFITFLLSVNFTEVILLLTVLLIWRNPELLPFLPLQILWINLITDSLPALALTFEQTPKNVMQQKPVKSNILQGTLPFIAFVSILAFFVGFYFFFTNMSDIATAQTMVITSSIIFQMFFVFNCKSQKSVLKSSKNNYLIAAVVISITFHLIALYSPLNTIFGFIPLTLSQWAPIIGLSALSFIIIELVKPKLWK